jgi:glucan phosphoethanolaminetransferase (alkaline phosphatase superfamily)
MTSETRALTEELHAVLRELRRVGDRLDQIENRARSEWRKSWWHRAVSALLLLVVLALGQVAFTQQQAVDARCDAIRDAFDTYTDALAAFSTASAERTDAEQDSFDRRVDLFRAEIRTRLADCN